MITICLANQKGGVGKTTSVITLGHMLARYGYKTLLLDTDLQGHVALSLGEDKGPGLYDLLVLGQTPEQAAIMPRDNLWLIPSNKDTVQAAQIVAARNFRERAIANALRGADYDVCLIDLAPSMDILHIAALMACQVCIIPTACDYLGLDGVKELDLTIQELNHNGARIQSYILPTFFDRVTKESTNNLKALVETFGAAVWPPIPRDVKAREAAAYGQSLVEFAPGAIAMIGYQIAGQGVGGYNAAFDRLLGVIRGY